MNDLMLAQNGDFYQRLYDLIIHDGPLDMGLISGLMQCVWKYVFENHISACYSELKNLYNAVLGYKRRNIHSENCKSAYCLGQLDMLFSWLENLSSIELQDDSIIQDAPDAPLKHLDEIVTVLSTNLTMTAGQIAERIGLKPSALSNTLKRYKDKGYVSSVKIGKFVFYSLDDKGKRLSVNTQKKLDSRTSDVSTKVAIDWTNQEEAHNNVASSPLESSFKYERQTIKTATSFAYPELFEMVFSILEESNSMQSHSHVGLEKNIMWKQNELNKKSIVPEVNFTNELVAV